MVALNNIKNQFLIEMDFYNPDTTNVETIRFATGKGFHTKVTETPSLAKYDPRIKDCGNVETNLFGRNTTRGSSLAEAGNVRLNNNDTVLDYLANYGGDGRLITIRERVGNNYPDDFPIRFRGVQSFADYTDRLPSVNITNTQELLLSQQYQETKYLGDSTAFEGEETDIGGKPKPIVMGYVRNIEPVLTEAATRTYQISSEPCDDLPNVYNGRTDIIKGTQHATLAALEAATVTAGEYDYYLGDDASTGNDRGCYMKLSADPSHRLTCDAIEGNKNLLLHSEDFTNTWIETGTGAVTANSDTSPDGLNNATTLNDNDSGVAYDVTQSVTIIDDSLPYSFGAYLKRGNTNQTVIEVSLTGGTGVTETITLDWNNLTVDVGNVTQVDDDWYRIDHVITNNSTGNTNLNFKVLPIGSTASFTGSAKIWGAFLFKSSSFKYYAKSITTSGYNNTVGGIVSRIMQRNGFTLDEQSALKLDADCAANGFGLDLEVFTGTREVRAGDIIDEIMQSVWGFWTDNIDGTYEVGLLKLPTAIESVYDIPDQLLLGRHPKVIATRNNDPDKGVPVYNWNVGYDINYTPMTQADLTGSSLAELSIYQDESRFTNEPRASVQVKHLSSTEQTIFTHLTTKEQAEALATYIADIYEVIRPMKTFKLPYEIAENMPLNSVVKLRGKYYRIIGRVQRFPYEGGNNDATNRATQLIGWGGVDG